MGDKFNYRYWTSIMTIEELAFSKWCQRVNGKIKSVSDEKLKASGLHDALLSVNNPCADLTTPSSPADVPDERSSASSSASRPDPATDSRLRTPQKVKDTRTHDEIK